MFENPIESWLCTHCTLELLPFAEVESISELLDTSGTSVDAPSCANAFDITGRLEVFPTDRDCDKTPSK